MKQNDFGQKIGGARKDMWSGRGLALVDLANMNAAERAKYVKKGQIWPKPDYKKMHEDGIDRNVIYFMKEVRNSLPTGPLDVYGLTVEEAQEAYIEAVSQIRDAVMRCRTIADVCAVRPVMRGDYVDVETIKSRKFYKAMPYNDIDYQRRHLEQGVCKEQFLYSEDEITLSKYRFLVYGAPGLKLDTKSDGTTRLEFHGKYGIGFCNLTAVTEEFKNPADYQDGTYIILKGNAIVGKNFVDKESAEKYALSIDAGTPAAEAKPARKTNLPLTPLDHMNETGFNYLKGRHAVEKDYLDRCGFRGVEFGNWVNGKERIQHMDMAFNSIMNLSIATGIDVKSLLFGRLAVAFGARGVGKAVAHYEPLREVINLTRMKGAGSLAHEMGHFLDDEIGREYDLGGYATEHAYSSHAPKAVKDLLDVMKKRTLSHAEAKIYLAEKHDALLEKTRKELLSMISKGGLTKDERDELDDLIDDFLEEAKSDENYHNVTFVGATLKMKRDSKPSPTYEKLIQFAKDHGVCSMFKMNITYANQCRSHIAESIRTMKKAQTVDPEIVVNSRYYDAAIALDGGYAHGGHGYYKSDVELFARAYAAYIKDKLAEKGIVDDYLCGHADSFGMTNLGITYVSPQGEERKRINAAFDALFAELVKDGTLMVRVEETKADTIHEGVYNPEMIEVNIKGAAQLSFDLFA